MSEELYNSSDYCSLVEQYEELQKENAELTADKILLIQAAMDGGDKYHYTAHDIGYRDLERKVKALEADYVISNRELLILQAELARRDEIITRLKEDADRILSEDLANAKDELKHRRDALVDAQNIYGDFFDKAVIALGFSSATLPTKEAEEKLLKRISDLFWLVRNLSDALDCVYGKLPAHWRELPFSYHELKRKVKEVMK